MNSQFPSHLTPQALKRSGSRRSQMRDPLQHSYLRSPSLCGVHSFLLAFILLHSSLILSKAASPPELTILRQHYDKVQAERVTAPHEAALKTLQSKYLAALESSTSGVKKAGRLDDVLALQPEQKRLAAGLTVPAVDEAEAPEVLKKLRTILREQIGRLSATRLQNLDTILPAYQAKLQSLEVTLTQADRIDEAKDVKEYRLALSTGSLAPATAPDKPPASPAAQGPGGVLKGLGQFMFGNLPVDLSNAEDLTDFVEVKVSHMGWIARRSNGEVRFQIQANGDKTKGTLNTKKAVRVCATEGKPFFVIYDDGTVEQAGTQFDKEKNPFPTEVSNVADMNAASGLYVVLHRDGACSFAGNNRDAFLNGLKLKAPGVLPEVAAVTCSRYQAFFLMKDGSITGSTAFRDDKVPELVKVPSGFRRDMRSIATGAGGAETFGVTKRGEVVAWDGKPLERGLKDLVEVKVGGNAAIVKNLGGKWQIARPGDSEMAVFLGTALATPKIIDIDLHNFDNSGDGKLVSRAVVWIEPAP